MNKETENVLIEADIELRRFLSELSFWVPSGGCWDIDEIPEERIPDVCKKIQEILSREVR